MGLIINDQITLKNGMSITGAYLSFNSQTVSLISGLSARLATARDGGKSLGADYTACGSYNLYASRDAMLRNCSPIEGDTVDCPVQKSDLSTPVHQILYKYIKDNIYPNSSDS